MSRREYRSTYHEVGFVVVPGVVSDPALWRDEILGSPHLHEVFTPEEKRTVAAGEGYNLHRALDRYELDATPTPAGRLYTELLEFVRDVAHGEAQMSPYERSAYYAKVYDAPGGQQGWHFDTNEISAILYLTTHVNSGATVVTALDGTMHRIRPAAGKLLLLQGTKCWHCAESVLEGSKVTVLLNYYMPEPPQRDPALDEIIFGSKAPDEKLISWSRGSA